MRHSEIIAICKKYGFSTSNKKTVVEIVEEKEKIGNERAKQCINELRQKGYYNK